MDKEPDISTGEIVTSPGSPQLHTDVPDSREASADLWNLQRGRPDFLEMSARDFPGYNPEENTTLSSSSSDSPSESSTVDEGRNSGTLCIDHEAPYIELHGEPFQIEIENGTITLSHDYWSLRGSGETLLEAQEDLYECARRLAPAYVYRTADKMTEEAARMRSYIAYVMSYAVR